MLTSITHSTATVYGYPPIVYILKNRKLIRMVYSAKLFQVKSVRYNESWMYYSYHKNINLQYRLIGIKKISEESRFTTSVNLHLGLISYSTVMRHSLLDIGVPGRLSESEASGQASIAKTSCLINVLFVSAWSCHMLQVINLIFSHTTRSPDTQ